MIAIRYPIFAGTYYIKICGAGRGNPLTDGYSTSSTYTCANAQSGDAGSYSVAVANSAGSVTSNTVTLTVNAAPSGGGGGGAGSGGGGGGGDASGGEGGGGGGGAPTLWFYGSLLLLVAARRNIRRPR